jgi:hypothetical protein
MKQSFILWTSAVIITFLISFFQNRTSPEYPISGTFVVDGQKVSYHLKKVHRDKGDYILMLRTDVKDLEGIVTWRKYTDKQIWNVETMKYSDGSLIVTIPMQDALSKIEYRISLSYINQKYILPKNHPGNILFLGPVPTSIAINYYLTLFIGLLLAIRAGLDFFNNKARLRLYSIFTLISFFSCAMIFAPVKKAYEMGAIGSTVPPISKLFEVWLIAVVIIWIFNLILVSYSRIPKKWVLISSIITMLLFFSQNFN